MLAILTRLTFALVAVIVVVLATYLILIAKSLIKANRNLANLVGGLEQIRDNTAPLAADLTAINGVAITLRDQLKGVDGHLERINQLVQG